MHKLSHAYKFIFPALVATLFFAACKKDDKSVPDTGGLVGNWLTTTFASDENRNGVVEDNERTPTDNTDSYFMRFDSDKRGEKRTADGSDVAAYNWELLNGDKDLRIIFKTNAGDTVHWLVHIVDLSNKKLTILDTSYEHLFYWEFNRQ